MDIVFLAVVLKPKRKISLKCERLTSKHQQTLVHRVVKKSIDEIRAVIYVYSLSANLKSHAKICRSVRELWYYTSIKTT